MNNVFRRSIPFLMATVFGTGVVGITGIANAQTQGDPPARVGRLAFAEGTVSFHDAQDTNWTPAAVNGTLTTGDSLWTEPNARSEISVAGTRVRLDQSTQLDMLLVDDSATRLQLDQGRLDIKTFTMDTAQPYEIVTPRGTVKLEAQGDYYIESGSTQDPTRLGVRSGAAQITGLNGQVLTVRTGEVAEISGDAQAPLLHTIRSAPPPVPQYWAQRDQRLSYAAPQYISADVVGYEDMQAYGGWSNDPDYGQVWSPNTVPANWQPYSTGSWAYSQPYGWTWVDEQPWGFAPYHYGRWANRNNRWLWVPPERRERAVYAPALVAFLGGAELAIALGNSSAQPVGWFPLGPREAYVPPYTNDRTYYERINTNARVERAILDDRWNRAERHEAIRADEQNQRMMNRRFATVVPAQAFARSEPVARVALKVDPQKLSVAPVAAVSAPPAPSHSLTAVSPGDAKAGDPKLDHAARAKLEADAKAQGSISTTNTRFNGGQEIARPAPADRAQVRTAPGPKIAATTPTQPTASGAVTQRTGNIGAKAALPPLEPRRGAAPPAIQGERTPVQANGTQPSKPGEPTKPNEAKSVEPKPNEANRAEPLKPGEAPVPGPQGQQATKPEVGKPEATKPEAIKPGEAPRPPQGQRPAENAHPPVPPAPHQSEAPRLPQQAPQAARPPEHDNKVVAPAIPPTPPKAAEPQRQGQTEPQRPMENHAAPAQPQRIETPHQPVTTQAPPQPTKAPAPQAPAPQPQNVQAPPVQHAAPPAAPPPQRVQAPPAPPVQHAPPQQAQVPQPQNVQTPPPVQHAAPPAAPPPQRVQAPPVQPAPPQQAQVPHPQAAPAPAPAPAPHLAAQPAPAKPEDKEKK